MLPTLLAPLGACRGGFEKHVEPASRAVLEDAGALESLTILALEPSLGPAETLPPDVDAFHGYRVNGRAEVSDPAERRRLLALVEKGMADSDDRRAACFAPRHGIRARGPGGAVDLVICYECLWMVIHAPDGSRGEAPTARGVEPDVTALFEAHGLSIAR